MDDRFIYKKSKKLRQEVYEINLAGMFFGLVITSIGGIITITCFIGSFGAQLEVIGLLNTSSSIIAIGLILELVPIILISTYKLRFLEYTSKIWDFLYQKDTKFISEVEQTFHCCGFESIHDRAIPKTCSIDLNIDTSCKESILNQFQRLHEMIGIIIATIILVQLVLLISTIILSRKMNFEAREEEMYMALLSSRNSKTNYHSWFGNSIGESSYNNNYFGRHYRSSQKSIPRYGSTPSS